MMSFNLHLIFLLSLFFVQQISASCEHDNNIIVCTLHSLYKPKQFDIINYGSNYNYKIIVTESFLPTLQSSFFSSEENIIDIEITNCNIKHLNIKDLVSLINLNLSHNNISNIDCFDNLLELKFIDLSYNNISEINHQFSSDLQINDLNLSHNKILNLTDHINLSNLVNLDLSYNYIKDISKTYFEELGILRTLKISNNNITKLELGMFKNLKSLTYLDLSHNYIKVLEYSSLSGLEMLKTLDVSYNYIISIPSISFHNFYNLKNLNVKANRLTKLETEDILDTIELTKIDFDENPMSCEMIAHLLKQFRKSKVEVVQGSSHGNSSLYGINCVKTDKLIASKSEHTNEIIQKIYSDFKSSEFMTLFQQIHTNLNSSMIHDVIEKLIHPEEKSYMKTVLGNFTDLIERNDKIVQRNQMDIKKEMDDIQINLKNNLNFENDVLKNISIDITKNAEKTKVDIVKITEEMKSMYNDFTRDSIHISDNFLANEVKKLKNGEDIKQLFQKMVIKLEVISNMHSKINNSNNGTSEASQITNKETVSMVAIFICIALLLVLISVILIAQIVFKIYFNKKTKRKLLQNELESIG